MDFEVSLVSASSDFVFINVNYFPQFPLRLTDNCGINASKRKEGLSLRVGINHNSHNFSIKSQKRKKKPLRVIYIMMQSKVHLMKVTFKHEKHNLMVKI